MMLTIADAVAAAKARARERCIECQLAPHRGKDGSASMCAPLDHTCHGDLEVVENAMLAAVGLALRPFNQHGWADLKARIKRQFGLPEGSERSEG